ncbi:fibroblast growth factor receptor-like 1 [Plakobranchus ocellatus]|uniref:receptor protein-tyrosine kinase n=1 Tax=Plakobranchus ocellatus TaxID=259542 RepID=A0AAV3XZT7_9GAST|nr:fibroblast growth factor receptor-like 1 [Plakobranchus ocellatus]
MNEVHTVNSEMWPLLGCLAVDECGPLEVEMRHSMGSVTVLRALLSIQAALLCAANLPPTVPCARENRVIAKLGKAVRLECDAHSSPSSDLYRYWKKDGQALNPGSNRYLKNDNRNLRIRPVQMNDAGVYTCIVTNGYGSDSCNHTVVVKDEENQVFQEGNRQFRLSEDVDIQRKGAKPMFENIEKMEEGRNLVKPKGSSISLSCRVVGNPRPEVHWLRNGQAFEELQQQNQMVKLRNNQAVLRLSNLSDKDEASYTCVAMNSLGRVNFTYTLTVVGEISAKPRLIAPHPINHTVAVGDSVSFHCYVQSDESDEKPDVEWLKQLKEGEQVPNPVPYNGQQFQVLRNAGLWLRERLSNGLYLNKLVIRNVQPSDEGMFVCSATNRMGFETRRAFLSVKPGTGHNSNRGQSIYNGRHSNSLDGSDDPSSRNPAPEDDDNGSNLPLQIALPACAVLALILISIFFMQRSHNRCRKSTPPAPPAPRPPVPPHEREAYYYSNCNQHHLHQQQQAVNPLLLSSREKMASTPKMVAITPTPSGELTGGSSDFSSVSRTHPSSNTTPYYYHHNHLNYGY